MRKKISIKKKLKKFLIEWYIDLNIASIELFAKSEKEARKEFEKLVPNVFYSIGRI